MTNLALEFTLEMMALPRDQAKDVLRGLLHAIFFHRLLNNVVPRELRVLETSVSITDSEEVQNLIEEKVSDFMHNTSPTQVKQGKVALFFYEKRLKKNWFQFSKTEEFVCWEQWVITLNLAPPPPSDQEKTRSIKSAENQFRQCLMKILEIVNESKEHIPSITTTDGSPFPYQIAIQSQTESWNSIMKRMIVTDAPSIASSSSSSNTTIPTNTTTHPVHHSRPNSIKSERRI